LALTPPLIIMDEPTTALDVIIEREILLKILELRKSLNFTILFITHDLNLLLEFADKIGVMKEGELIEVGITEKIKLGGQKEYTKKLISSIPSASGKRGVEFFPEPNLSIKTGAPMLEMKNINKEYLIGGFFNKKTLHAVKDFSLRIFKGEIIGLVGESGSGKSTIAQLITRLETQTSGSILLNGTDLKRNRSKNVSLGYRKKVQMIFQDPFGSLNNIHNVYHHLSRPIIRHNIVPKRKLEKYIYKLLESVELSPGKLFAKKFPHEMSGGERQRVAIARALSVKPDLVIADEPTSMLDVSIRMDILRILAKLRNEHNVAILFITHDLASARYLADRIIVLQNGKKIEQGISEDLIQSPKELYTKQLIAAASPGWLKNAILEQ
ncbi:ATP-binding cassette domain-containing protein, partial [Candidatus Marinimicrobia bacterium]|nr:ATP-binding cassette domain-containing protein [Candidatus Neomarinimicrobiota bacterium]